LLLAALLLVAVEATVSVLVGVGHPGRVLDRHDVLEVAAQSAPSTPARPTVSPRGAAPLSAAEVTARLKQLLAWRPGIAVSIAALDLTNSRRYQYPGGRAVRTASVVKLDILEAVLLQHQQSGQPLNEAEATDATAMIEHNDNDATDTLWDKIGGADGFRAANRQLGTKRTNPDVDRYWGLTTSDADDQLTLLRNLVDDHPLSPDSRIFALSLLGKPDPAQAWGVSAAADPGSSPALKNGSIKADNDNGLWAVGASG
jgi:beta-lactamase class A